ncbi:hypothetical protein [Nonomuraea sp. NPDC003214]
MRTRRPPVVKRARRRANRLDRLYRDELGGRGSDREEVATDIIADMLLSLPGEAWPHVLNSALVHATTEQYGSALAKETGLLLIGGPEEWEGC